MSDENNYDQNIDEWIDENQTFDYSLYLIQNLKNDLEKQDITTNKIPIPVVIRSISLRLFRVPKRSPDGFTVRKVLSQMVKDHPELIQKSKRNVILS